MGMGAEAFGIQLSAVTPPMYDSAMELEWSPPEYNLEIGRSYVRVVRRGNAGHRGVRRWPVWDTEEGREIRILIGAGTPRGGRRGDQGLSSRSAANMRRTFQCLPWERLARPALISLTYPGDWRRWVADGRTLERHRTALRRRWEREWGEPMAGVWVKEFQQRGAPHLHLYVALPKAVTEGEMERLRERATTAKRLERDLGRYQGRGQLRWGNWDGAFVPWLRTSWSEIVGTQGITRSHHGRGVDVRVFFFTEEQERLANRDRVARYLAMEATKWRQKQPPNGFLGVGRCWGYWRGSVRFLPDVQVVALDWRVGYEFQHRVARWVRLKMRAAGKPLEQFDQRRDGDGITAYGLGNADVLRLLRWSAAAVERKIRRWGAWGLTRPGHPVLAAAEVVPAVDKETGEVVA